MLFNSIQYLIFLPAVFILYYTLPNKLRNIFLLAASLYFYACWMPKYLILILGTVFITYIASILIDKYEKHKKVFLIFGILINLAILIIFKYNDFFIHNINRVFNILHLNFTLNNKFNFMLPVGISFYTFQSIGYCIDVYRKDTKCEKNLIIYATFVTFFPQLVAGPIERSSNLIKQFHTKHKFEYAKGVEGLRYILSGMFRKVVVADMCAVIVNGVYNNLHGYTGSTLIVATLLFSIQIYCDFSGYSLIAIGSGKLLGFDLMENFKSPYLSTNIKEFWNRWHISLSSWFKDYIYIPLGGSRKGFRKKLINIFIIFFISGLWHGAAWTFVIWGIIHAMYRIIEEIIKKCQQKNPVNQKEKQKLLEDKNVQAYIELNHKELNKAKKYDKIIEFEKILGTFALASFAWIFFRANSFHDALYVIKNALKTISLSIVHENNNQIISTIIENNKVFVDFFNKILTLSILYLIYEDYKMKKENCNVSNVYQMLGKKRYIVYIIQAMLIIIMHIILTTNYGQTGQFIYFQF